jgi:hypothetical protein
MIPGGCGEVWDLYYIGFGAGTHMRNIYYLGLTIVRVTIMYVNLF